MEIEDIKRMRELLQKYLPREEAERARSSVFWTAELCLQIALLREELKNGRSQ